MSLDKFLQECKARLENALVKDEGCTGLSYDFILNAPRTEAKLIEIVEVLREGLETAICVIQHHEKMLEEKGVIVASTSASKMALFYADEIASRE